VFRKIIKEVKEIEVLVNNAGFYRPNPSRQEKSLMKNTKLVGYQLLSEIGIKSGVKSIVNISSMFAGSNISKTAKVQREIELITIRLAKKYLGKARINCVRPGLNSGGTFLEVHSKQEIKKYLKLMPDNKMVSVHEIAKTVKFIAENKSITGQIISVDKGASLILS
ncbi:MAG: SDR family oxidoreductase, partial [Candidatus Diapherotrites archaeon]|nr:SDR family oxidoreductase [Candidatus Diapherotrites archaeon]